MYGTHHLLARMGWLQLAVYLHAVVLAAATVAHASSHPHRFHKSHMYSHAHQVAHVTIENVADTGCLSWGDWAMGAMANADLDTCRHTPDEEFVLYKRHRHAAWFTISNAQRTVCLAIDEGTNLLQYQACGAAGHASNHFPRAQLFRAINAAAGQMRSSRTVTLRSAVPRPGLQPGPSAGAGTGAGAAGTARCLGLMMDGRLGAANCTGTREQEWTLRPRHTAGHTHSHGHIHSHGHGHGRARGHRDGAHGDGAQACQARANMDAMGVQRIDNGALSVVDRAACCIACSEHSRCRAWVWAMGEEGAEWHNCWLLAGYSGTKPVKGRMLGVPQHPTWKAAPLPMAPIVTTPPSAKSQTPMPVPALPTEAPMQPAMLVAGGPTSASLFHAQTPIHAQHTKLRSLDLSHFAGEAQQWQTGKNGHKQNQKSRGGAVDTMLGIAKWGLVILAAGATLFLISAIVAPTYCRRAVQQRAKHISRDAAWLNGGHRATNSRGKCGVGNHDDDQSTNEAELTRLVAGYGSSQDTRPQLVFSRNGVVSCSKDIETEGGRDGYDEDHDDLPEL